MWHRDYLDTRRPVIRQFDNWRKSFTFWASEIGRPCFHGGGEPVRRTLSETPTREAKRAGVSREAERGGSSSRAKLTAQELVAARNTGIAAEKLQRRIEAQRARLTLETARREKIARQEAERFALQQTIDHELARQARERDERERLECEAKAVRNAGRRKPKPELAPGEIFIRIASQRFDADEKAFAKELRGRDAKGDLGLLIAFVGLHGDAMGDDACLDIREKIAAKFPSLIPQFDWLGHEHSTRLKSIFKTALRALPREEQAHVVREGIGLRRSERREMVERKEGDES